MIYYKVVTKNMTSLGLRKNPMILNYKLNKWVISPNISHDGKDSGGIWCCKQFGNATKLVKYMLEKYNKKVRIFQCHIDKILYENSYRTKTNKILFQKEIK